MGPWITDALATLFHSGYLIKMLADLPILKGRGRLLVYIIQNKRICHDEDELISNIISVGN